MKRLKKRSEIEEKYLWKLSDIFENAEAWNAEYKQATDMLGDMGKYKDTMLSSAEELYAALSAMDEVSLMAERLYVYARMSRDTDNANSTNVALTDKAHSLMVKLSSALSYVNPLLTKAKSSQIEEYIKAYPKLADYDFFLREIMRQKKHILTEKEENILAKTGDFSSGAKEIFTMLNNADMTFGRVKDESGENCDLTHGNYVVFLQSKNIKIRRSAYKTYYKSFKAHINTLAAAYATSVKKDIFYANVRGYKTPLAGALYSDNVPESLYLKLIEIISNNLSTMREYLDFRREKLSLKKLHMYDLFAPLTSADNREYTYEEAVELNLAALTPLGDDYLTVLKDAFEQGWVDVYETKGKTSGAYSWGAYGTHPYVLLNHRSDLNSVFTVAHEMGHALHTYYSNKTQPYPKSGYTIFVAEVASTVNEILLTHYLLKKEQDVEMKKILNSHYLDQFRTTVFRQTMFAEFEMLSHNASQEGEPLTPESLSNIYGELNSKYYMKSMTDSDILYEWARIPHFYNAFYVYKYATGFSCAVKIAKELLAGNKEMQKGYLNFLCSGGSDFPLAQLKLAGVDLVSGEPIQACMDEFAQVLKEFKSL